ncbi:MAG: Serine/threonine-protein kinase pkn1 [Candidatus Accumulibacter phosphatis]|uniref:Serine/threonine-protein kinase pkn1 n=2 Tax=Candidatus Accumulibacter TaxID=327159 RepID=A0A080LUD1_9PROT|nr:MAG: Serine/threonine-protein kinase pkn1 [Candidatus Accumulibacter phosphatis]
MSWREPGGFEERLVANFRAEWGERAPVVRLARLLAPATRIEPLLLRNARLHFLPGSGCEIESLLWFSRLVAARGNRDIVFHAGVSRLLANTLQHDAALFEAAIDFIERHTSHWPPEDRLEQTMRLATLRPPADAPERRQDDSLRNGLRDMLQLVADEGDEKRRVRLARSIRQTLATIGSDRLLPCDELHWLRQYTSVRLGTTAETPADASRPALPLPAWIGESKMEPVRHFRCARLAVTVHYDRSADHLVLHIRETSEAGGAGETIPLPTPLPAELHVDCAGTPARWHVIHGDDRLRLPIGSAATSLPIVLTTIDGSRYRLEARLPDDRSPPLPARLLLSHLPEDREQARAIAGWLRRNGIGSELVEEVVAPSARGSGDEPTPALPILRLWTPAAQRRQQVAAGDLDLPAARSALLRLDPAVDLPQPGYAAEKVIDLRGWQNDQAAAIADDSLRQLNNWLSGADREEPPLQADKIDDEVARLFAELDDPATTPPQRLAIGDRLAEIGDPRPGVGVREFVVDEEAAAGDKAVDEAAVLLAELQEAATIPPRRLAIGDRLAEIRDPRRGVGLDSRGVPEIDWVEIPGGEFLYQKGEKRSLPTFYMARYPLTNAQFQAFIDAGAYGDVSQGFVEKIKSLLQAKAGQRGDWWRDLRRPEPQPSRWQQSNRPRTNVDWYEALAFTRWLSQQLGYEVRLPTEEEWERAARGRDGREYPWGNSYESGRANINETWDKTGEWTLGQTTAVGIYPHGASPEGVLDLAGNVWEWCLNNSDHSGKSPSNTSDVPGVLRGGSWDLYADYARAVQRIGFLPDNRRDGWGFRLVSSAPMT